MTTLSPTPNHRPDSLTATLRKALHGLRLGFAALSLLAMAACHHPKADRHNTTADSTAVVTVTIAPLRTMVERLMPEGCKVMVLMPQGGSAETFQPSPRQLVTLQESQMVVGVGTLTFEQTTLDRMKQTAHGVTFITLGDSITPLSGHHHHGHDESLDPHVWLSLPNLCTMARRLAAALSLRYPAEAKDIDRRCDTYVAELQKTDTLLRQQLAATGSRSFLIQHPSLGYFARDYGLHQIAIETDGKEPSAARMKELEQHCRHEKVGTVFVQDESSNRTATNMARRLGLHVVTLQPLADDVPQELMRAAKAL